MACDGISLCTPASWIGGLVVFGVGLWAGLAVALRRLPASSWRKVLGTAFIAVGALALPSATAIPSRAPTAPSSAPTASQRAQVIVAKVDLPAHTVLTSDDVDVRDVATDAVQPNAATSLADVQGKVTTALSVAGEQILTHRLASAAVTIPGQPGAEIVAAQLGPTDLKVGDVIDVSITITNTSDKPLQTTGPDPGFTYVQGQTYFTQQFASDSGKWRVAIGTAGLDSTELPYRWGLGGDLAPGASTTVTGHIKVTQDFKATNFWAALVNEPSTVVQTGVGMTQVTSVPQHLAIVAVDATDRLSGQPQRRIPLPPNVG